MSEGNDTNTAAAATSAGNNVLTLTDVVDAGVAAVKAATAPPAAPAPPPDLMQIISEGVAVYVAAMAGGKDWWRSKGMWGAIGSLTGGLGTVVVALLPGKPVWLLPAIGAFTVFAAQLAAHGRATATGPIR